jgi:peptidyl-prolyl cis-trans isomerase B (cyclophilin B)
MPRPRTYLPSLALAGAIALAGCGGGDDSGKTGASTAASTQTSTGCTKVAEPAPKQVKESKPDAQLDPAKTYVATIQTNCGAFQITLDPKQAPKTGGSFVSLAKKGFFDGLTFHRIVAGFVIQGGDPAGDGTGGPGYSVREKPPSTLKYVKGVVAMAKTEIEPKGTSGSQFFVVTAEDAQLPPDYALLGTVTKGMEVVDKIGVAQADPQTQRPLDPIVMSKVTIDES